MATIIQRGFQEDSLVCGSCQRNFPFDSFSNFVQHKQFHCEELASVIEALACQSCPAEFGTPWSLLMHAQNVHSLKIYFERTSEKFGNERETEQKRRKFHNEVASFADNGKQNVTSEESVRKIVKELDKYSLNSDAEQDVNVVENVTYNKRSIFRNKIENSRSKIDEISSENSLTTTDEAREGRAKIQIDVVKDDHNSSSGFLSSHTPEFTNQRPPDTLLKKCCSSVVPKKRKRHMEMKHMIGGMGSGSMKGRRRVGSTEGPTSIFIDFEPQEEFLSKCSNVQYDSNCGADSEGCESNGQSGNERRHEARFYQPRKQHSVIIQPGMTFSIPVSYSMEPSVSIYNSSASSSVTFPRPQRMGMAEDEMQGKGSRRSEEFSLGSKTGSMDGDRRNEDDSGPYEEKPMSEQLLSLQPAAAEASVQSGKDIIFGVTQGLDNQGQKKRRYPTSRPFKCDQCEDSFNQRIHLQKHQSKHTGVKPFKCDRCDYSTVERSHLKVHIRVHTGEKPYKCTYCGYATAQNSTLKIHLKRHHLTNEEMNMFTCGTCGMHFKQRDTFDNHSVQEHNQKGSANSTEETSRTVMDQTIKGSAKTIEPHSE